MLSYTRAYGSPFSAEKKRFENPIFGCRDIKQKWSLIFLGHPVVIKKHNMSSNTNDYHNNSTTTTITTALILQFTLLDPLPFPLNICKQYQYFASYLNGSTISLILSPLFGKLCWTFQQTFNKYSNILILHFILLQGYIDKAGTQSAANHP